MSQQTRANEKKHQRLVKLIQDRIIDLDDIVLGEKTQGAAGGAAGR